MEKKDILSARRILIIAPDPGFRRSLAFALTTEGHVITSCDRIPVLDSARGYDCVVLDHKATVGLEREAVLQFVRTARCTVVLAGRPQPWLTEVATSVVQTPVMGEALYDALATALSRVAPASDHSG